MNTPANVETYVIIPAYNEASSLPSVVAPLVELGYAVVVVDDGSSDGSWEVLASLPVARVRHPINLGQGAALQTGTTYALRAGARYVVHFDADGQHDCTQIEAMLEPIRRGTAEIVLGSRFMRSEDLAHVPWVKRLLLKGGVVISGISSGLWLTDTHNGFRALSRKAAGVISITENGFAHATEILCEIRRHRLSYVEQPVTIRYSNYSKGKGQSPWNAFNIVVDLMLRRLFR